MMPRPTIALDTYGGAAGPQGMVAAAARMARQGVARVVLVGDVGVLQSHLSTLSYDPMNVRLLAAPADYPRRPDDVQARAQAARVALPVAMQLLANNEVDALVTASPTELVFQMAHAHLPVLPQVPALAAATVIPCMPRRDGGDPLALLLDVSGLRAHSARELVMFAVMGAAYARVVTGVTEPTVALLSTGASPDDGPPEVVEAHRQLKGVPGVRFVGNVRATEVSRGTADVVVADGLVGHAVRGLLDGLTTMTVDAARYAWKTKLTWRLGLRLLAQGVGMLRQVQEFQSYGGAPVLGLRHLLLCASPESGTPALENAIKLAARCHGRGLQSSLADAIAAVEGGV